MAMGVSPFSRDWRPKRCLTDLFGIGIGTGYRAKQPNMDTLRGHIGRVSVSGEIETVEDSYLGARCIQCAPYNCQGRRTVRFPLTPDIKLYARCQMVVSL